MAEVGVAFVTIAPSLKGFGAQLERGVTAPAAKAGDAAGKKSGGRFSAGFKAAAAGAIGAAVAAKTIGFLKDATAEAREAQKVGAITNQIIKQTGGIANVSAAGVSKLADSLSRKTGIDDEAIQSGSNMLLTFKNVRNEVGKGNAVFTRATQAAVDLSIQFGGIDSASKQLGKALNDPIKGTTALSKAGVTFTDQQKEQIRTLVQSGDVLGAQKIILAEVESQVGGVAAASATSGEKLTQAFGRFKESIGASLIPAIDGFNNKMVSLFGFLEKNRPVAIGLAVVVGGILAGAFAFLAVAVIAATWPFLLAGIAIAALAVGFIYAWKHSEKFRIGVRFLGAAAVGAGALFLRMGASVVTAVSYMLGALGKIKSDKFQWARDGSVALAGVADKLNAGAAKADGLAASLTKVPKKTNADVKTSKLDKPVKDTKTLGTNIKAIPKSAAPKITVPSLAKPITETANLRTGINRIPPRKTAKISQTGAPEAIRFAKDLKSAIDKIPTSHNTHYTWTGSSKEGSAAGKATASGGIFTGAQTRLIGEAGPEAVVPLNRPLSQVDPSVRWLSAYAQGKTNLSDVSPISLDRSFGGADGASAGPAPVYVVNAREVADGVQRVAESVVSEEKSFASTMGRMG